MEKSLPNASTPQQADTVLRLLWERDLAARPVTTEDLAGVWSVARQDAVLRGGQLVRRGLVRFVDETWVLTPEGREIALLSVRAHRLYETYLARETGLPAHAWHREAEAKDHQLSAGEVDALADHLGHPRFDPHGDPIPTRQGAMPHGKSRIALLETRAPGLGRILHLEDEPEAIYNELYAFGLAPGQICRWTPQPDMHWEVEVEGRRRRLNASHAVALHLEPLEAAPASELGMRRLTDLKDGEAGRVLRLSAHCRGPARERLLDLGFVPGSPVARTWASPMGSPVAYRVRGALVGLRAEQSDAILLHPADSSLSS